MISNSITPNDQNDINGIIHYLYNTKRSRFDKYVSVSAIDTYSQDGWSGPEVLINPTVVEDAASANWCSSNTEDSFVIIGFRYLIELNSYSFKIRTHDSLIDYPVSWKAYGSIDNKTWSLIDSKEDKHDFEQNTIITMEPDVFGYFRYFKFVQTINNANRNHFCLNSLHKIKKIHFQIFLVHFLVQF